MTPVNGADASCDSSTPHDGVEVPRGALRLHVCRAALQAGLGLQVGGTFSQTLQHQDGASHTGHGVPGNRSPPARLGSAPAANELASHRRWRTLPQHRELECVVLKWSGHNFNRLLQSRWMRRDCRVPACLYCLQYYHTVTVLLPHCYCTTTPLSLYYYHTLTVLLQHCHCTSTTLSLYYFWHTYCTVYYYYTQNAEL